MAEFLSKGTGAAPSLSARNLVPRHTNVHFWALVEFRPYPPSRTIPRPESCLPRKMPRSLLPLPTRELYFTLTVLLHSEPNISTILVTSISIAVMPVQVPSPSSVYHRGGNVHPSLQWFSCTIVSLQWEMRYDAFGDGRLPGRRCCSSSTNTWPFSASHGTWVPSWVHQMRSVIRSFLPLAF